MARLSDNYTKREQKQSRVFTCELYPDSSSYDCDMLLRRLSYYWDKYYYILHDKDVYTEEDYDKYLSENKYEPDWVIGQRKKPHYHVIGVNGSPCMLGRAAKKFGVPSNHVQPVQKFKNTVQYLIHLNNPNKYQYEPEEIITNDESLPTILKRKQEAEEKADMLLQFILTSDVCSITELSKYAIKNHLWDELRRGQHIYTALLNEKRFINESYNCRNQANEIQAEGQ